MRSVRDAAAGRSPRLFEPLSSGASNAADRLQDNNFDALRLTFASMVVLFHMGYLSQVSSLAWMTHISATFAVQAFFVVSGFLVTMSFENSSSVRSCASKRFRRIVPAYVTVVFAAALALSELSVLPLHEYFTNREFWRYLGYNLVLSNFSAPSLPGVFESNFVTAVNGSLWTIKIEVAFYCFVPILVMASRRFTPHKVLLTVFTLAILWKLAFNFAAAATGLEIYTKLAKQLPGQLSFFAGGAWAFYRTRGGGTAPLWAAAVAAAAYATSGDGWLSDCVAPLAVTAIVYWAAVAGPRLPRVARYGDFSYGVYLFHFPLIQALIALGVYRWSASTGALILAVALASCAALSWHWVEQPMLHRRPART